MTRRAPPRAAAVLWTGAGVSYLAAEAASASAFPGYDLVADYISALGVPGRSPLAVVMNLGFLAQGLLFAAAGVLVSRATAGRARLVFAGLAIAHGLGNVLVAFVHSGSPPAGVDWHVVGAALAIGGGNAAVLTAGLARFAPVAFRAASVGFGTVGLACLLPLAAGRAAGAWERGSVYAIIGWELLAAVAVLCSSAAKNASQGSPSSTRGPKESSSERP